MTDWINSEVAISEPLRQIMDSATQEEREHFARLLLLLLQGFEASAKEPEVRRESPAQTARRLHEAADMRIEEASQTELAQQITCRKGCAHCCHINVSVTPEEADLLLEVGLAKGLSIDPKRLLKQIHWKDEDWLQQPRADARCVFLGDDNTCQVYEDRPLSCRKYFVVTEPELCNIEKHPGEKVGSWADAELEIIVTAVWTFYGVDTLPRQLMAAMLRKAGLKKEVRE